MKKKTGKREVSLRAWLVNHSAIDTAKQCGCSRVAIGNAANDPDRNVRLTVNGDEILDAFEEKVSVFGFGVRGSICQGFKG
jgi:hypothetical protein